MTNGRQQQQPLGAMQQLQIDAAPIPPQREGRGGYNQQPQPREPAYGMMPPPQQQMIIPLQMNMDISDTTKCSHGSIEFIDTMCIEFVIAFREAFYSSAKAKESDGIDVDISDLLVDAGNATLDEFAAVWNDSSKMEMAMSYFLYYGTQNILEVMMVLPVNRDDTRHCAIFARYFEQHIAVKLDQTQAIMNLPKLFEAYRGDMHTLVKYFRKRIPCSCLDGKYDEVKAITKLGFCFNPECNSNFVMSGELERSKTMYCSRCRCATYCSRECQKADWARHKSYCDKDAAERAEFDAKTKKKRPNAP